MTASKQLRKREGYGTADVPSAQAGSWIVSVNNFPAIATTTIDGPVVVSNLPALYPVTGNFWPDTQPVSGPLTNVELRTAPLVVSAEALPLPPGAATAARQDTGNTSLASIDGKLTAPLTVTGPLTDAQIRASALPVSGTFWQVTQPVSGTFWQAVQPVSIESMPSTPVTGPLTDTQLRASAVPVADSTLYTIDPTPHLRSQRALQAMELQILATPSGGFVPCEIPAF